MTEQQRERLAALACVAWLAVGLWAPALSLPPEYHQFADARTWLGLPCAADVLSNAAFALAGVWLWWRAMQVPHPSLPGLPSVQWAAVMLTGAGLLLTAAGSSVYHWHPDDLGLVIDRMGMGVAFAGLLGVAVADRIGDRAALALTGAVLLLAPLAAALAWQADNATPWLVLQAGGLLVLLALAWCPALPGRLAVPWGWVVAVYALAKLLELGDQAVFGWTHGLVAGHTLKHVVAACAIWPLCAALSRRPHRLAGALHVHSQSDRTITA